MSIPRAPLQNGPYKNKTHTAAQKHAEHEDATDIPESLAWN